MQTLMDFNRMQALIYFELDANTYLFPAGFNSSFIFNWMQNVWISIGCKHLFLFSWMQALICFVLVAWMQAHIYFQLDANLDGFSTGCQPSFALNRMQTHIYFRLDLSLHFSKTGCKSYGFNRMQTPIPFELDAFRNTTNSRTPKAFKQHCETYI